MKENKPDAEGMAVFARLQISFILVASAAFIVWELQDFAASFAAADVITQTKLRTTTERDDSRVQRAFDVARRTLHPQSAVSLTTEPDKNPALETRDAELTVVAKSKADALTARGQMVEAMQAAFKADGGGALFDVGPAPHAVPVQNAAYLLVRRTFRIGALLILLAGLVNLALGWKRSKLPRLALVGILATAFTLSLIGLGSEANEMVLAIVVAGPPFALIAVIAYLAHRVRRARSWTEGTARITKSKVEAKRHRLGGEPTRVRNFASIEYEFEADGRPIRSDRIGIGFGTADNADVVVKRYAVGARVPVFYDSAAPDDCVLERSAPVSFGCLWSGAISIAIAYSLIMLNVTGLVSLDAWLKGVLPAVHHPFLVIVTGLLGTLALATGIWYRLHPQTALPWVKTRGAIVSSGTESYEEDVSAGSRRVRTLFRPVIEYRYTVEGQEYRGSNNTGTGVTISSGKAWADAEVAKCPVGMEVDVFFDPSNPSRSGLAEHRELVLNGAASLVVGPILLGIAWYLATH